MSDHLIKRIATLEENQARLFELCRTLNRVNVALSQRQQLGEVKLLELERELDKASNVVKRFTKLRSA